MDRNIILITIDCLRPDHMGCYGYDRDTTPNIDTLAKKGAMMRWAFSGGPSTPPSFNTLFTSTYPFSGDGFSPLPHSKKTLAEVLSARGILTGGFNSNAFLGRSYNYQRGFDRFENPFRDPGHLEKRINGLINRANYRKMRTISLILEWLKITFVNGDVRPYLPADEITGMASSWMKGQKGAFFLWIHYMDAHHPYQPHNRFLKEWGLKPGGKAELVRIKNFIENRQGQKDPKLLERIREIYDAAIHFIDQSVGSLVDQIPKRHKKRTNIFILADHGEEFGEHGNVGHPGKLYDELIHIPLIMNGPDVKEGTVHSDLVSNIDIAPTVLDMLGIEDLREFRGRSFLSMVNGMGGKGRGVVISQAQREGRIELKEHGGDRIWSFRTDSWKLIRNMDGSLKELYDLKADPKERTNLANMDLREEHEMDALFELHQKGSRMERTGSEKNKLSAVVKKIRI